MFSERAEILIKNVHIATMDQQMRIVDCVAIQGDKIIVAGAEADVMPYASDRTQVIDAQGHSVIPGLNDSHLHMIRGGLSYMTELRWDGVPSLDDAMKMLREQAQRTPPNQWVRVVGGWSEFQFAERRMPTLDEINYAAPDTPVFVLHLYDRAFLNAAALRAIGYTKDTPEPMAGEIQRDHAGNPTGLLIATPNSPLKNRRIRNRSARRSSAAKAEAGDQIRLCRATSSRAGCATDADNGENRRNDAFEPLCASSLGEPWPISLRSIRPRLKPHT
ncbi:MAG TPA: amidohydrolase family protein [Planctomycetota bacterium]|jgi:hypothetical protein